MMDWVKNKISDPLKISVQNDYDLATADYAQ